MEVEDVQVELQGWVEGAKAAMVSSSRISCYIEDGNGRLDQDNSVCQRESE